MVSWCVFSSLRASGLLNMRLHTAHRSRGVDVGSFIIRVNRHALVRPREVKHELPAIPSAKLRSW
jgi:hypothetical protein